MSLVSSLRLFLIGVFLLIPMMLNAQDTHDKKMGDHKSGHIMKMPSELTWVDGPPSLPKGVKMVMLEGDMKTGPFTVRAKFPANYKIQPHTHPGVEHVTVLNGSCYMGMGNKIDETKASQLKAGSFMAIDPGTEHFLYTKEECEIQLHGVAPWGITYLNAADDPRNMTTK